MSNVVVSLQNANIYQQETLVLSDVNIDIKKGDFIYLIGQTGSGKSSLLKILYGDLALQSGKGKVVDFELEHLTLKQLPYLRRKLGIVFQDFQLLTDRTVDENLKFVLKATGWKDDQKIKNRIEEVLTLVKLNTKHFKKPHELSGGEQQRVVIARALLNHPEIVLADEPTGNLDPDTSDDIMKLLFEINKNTSTTFLVATHDYSIMEKFPSTIIKCVGGKVVMEESLTIQ
ncbi:MAG: ATP-binding cassette domain-containing protein [Bacteroidetes bacterium]|nr:ATP-binding cassette domain-containing protein [Bacteroidota bacterium]